MKSLLLALLLTSSTVCFAAIPATFDDLSKIYGKPLPRTNSPHSSPSFEMDDISITITQTVGGLSAIEYSRTLGFSDLEIDGILKPLSPSEAWKKVGDHDWILPKAGAKAHWDGEGKIVVTGS